MNVTLGLDLAPRIVAVLQPNAGKARDTPVKVIQGLWLALFQLLELTRSKCESVGSVTTGHVADLG